MDETNSTVEERPQPRRRGHIRRQALARLIPSAAFAVGGAAAARLNGNIRSESIDRRLLAWAGVIVFIIFATACLHVFTRMVRKIISRRLSTSRAANIEFIMRVTGYIIVILATLALIEIPVGKLLLGGAVMGIVLGVAAQQALANFFATMVLIIAHPFTVGQRVILNSGSLGRYEGTITDMSLSHTRLQEDDGTIVFLPNAALLSGAAITPLKKLEPKQPK